MSNNFITPTWTQIGEMQEQIDILHDENALKLKQILDLEQLLYDLRKTNIEEYDYEQDRFISSPCWCRYPIGLEHSLECLKARQATEPFWKNLGNAKT